jgi:NADH-quinone oxidoreductase subunit N
MIDNSLNLVSAWPEIFLLLMICVILLSDLFLPKTQSVITYSLAILALLGSFSLVFLGFKAPAGLAFNHLFMLDHLGQVLKGFILFGVCCTLIYAREYVKERALLSGEFYSLALLSTLGMMVMVSSTHLISLYLGLELMTFPIYTMVALERDSMQASEAAVKYFIMGALASGILLYGFSLLYGLTGQLELTEIAKVVALLSPEKMMVASFALVFLIVGIGFKFGAFPFHMWIPDVYAGSPAPMTLFVATAPKIAGLGFGLRLLTQAVPSLHLEWQVLLMVLSIFSMLIGNFAAIMQTNLRRMLGYSTIAHSGYMMLGFIAGTQVGFQATVFYMAVYLLMSLCVFGLLVMMNRLGVRVEELDDLKGLNHRYPWLAFMMLIAMFSLAGIPPFLGFFSKLIVLESLVSVHLFWLAGLALLLSVVGAYYYIRVIKVMYFEEPVETGRLQFSTDALVLVSVNGLLLLGLGLFPTPLFDLCRLTFS